MKMLVILNSFVSIQAFAAICSCDAAPACGPRPSTCFRYGARNFVGKVFVEKGSPVPTKLSFYKLNNSGGISVSYGSPLDGMPFGNYYVYLTSESTFNLMLAPFNGRASTIVDKFEFVINLYTLKIESLHSSDGTIFLPETTTR